MQTDAAPPREAADFDLTRNMAPFLDRHMMLQLYTFLEESTIYPSATSKANILRAQVKLLETTSMLDMAVDKYAQLGEEVPAWTEARRQPIMDELTGAQEKVMDLLHILEQPDKVHLYSQLATTDEVCKEFQISVTMLDQMKDFAKLNYETGNYQMCSELLRHYSAMMDKEGNTAQTSLCNCWWGHLACHILEANWEPAVQLVQKIDTYLETAKLTQREVLLQRSWLLHWAVFIIFGLPLREKVDKFIVTGDDNQKFDILAWFLSEKSLSIISLSCPHLLRYVGACLILHKRLKHILKDTVAILYHEAGSYKDPVTSFLLALQMDMDFDDAQQELQRCELVCQADKFLKEYWRPKSEVAIPDFEENARLLVFETYCRIHQCINIGMLATKLNMEAEEAELWIVKLIQNAKLDARIDSEKHRVVMSKAPPSVYQQVIEKTKNLSFRSTMLLSNLDKKEKEKETGNGLGMLP